MTDPNSLTPASGPDFRTELPESLLLAQMERGFGDLQFFPALEKPFRRYLQTYLVNHLRLACVAGLILIAAAQLLSSFVLHPPATALRWQAVLLCGALAPILLNAFWMLSNSQSGRRLDFAAYSAVGALAFAGLTLPLIYRLQGSVFPYPLTELVVVLIPILAARRFPIALLCVLCVLGGLILRDMLFLGISAGTMLDVFNITAFAAVSLAGGFVQEWVLRRNFLSEGLYLLRSVRDPLTQLRNRRGFDADAERIWATARRSNLSVGVAMIDIDHFKRLNDRWGHAAGDAALKELAHVLRAEAARRPMDLIGRVGGEEFAVIWYDLPPGSARTQAERVRQAVVDRRLEHPTDRQLSVSIGCTQLIPRGGLTLSDALAVADSALYSAKSNGRNCVEYVPPPRELDSQRWSQPTAVND